MAELKYKTRGNSEPDDKPRVYFTCHPSDFDSCFPIAAQDILKRQNCAIFYRNPQADYDKEDLLSRLTSMQLFVIPVTEQLLNGSCLTLDLEFPFALEQKIPVLPVFLQKLDPGTKSSLAGRFNQIPFGQSCTNMQILDKYPDPTAISYDEKLTGYLSSHLIGDELSQKIRAAFDAYIFLSYRKKNRKQATELMHLIHENPDCQSIAIWYDEFLNPGESFTDSIAHALGSCSLFALCVTPDILEPGNFVRKEEIPEALNQGKRILPIEMSRLDSCQRTELKSSFPALPECVDPRDSASFAQTLSHTIRQLAITPHSHTPQHNFFIGLAYLGGISVEVDRSRAVELISGAADAGLPDAVRQLVRMYRYGNGVDRDPSKGTYWQQTLVRLMKQAYHQEPSVENGLACCDALMDLGDYYHELRRQKEAADAFLEAKAFCESLASTTESDFVRTKLSVICWNLGRICYDERDLGLAERYFQEATSQNASPESLQGLNMTGSMLLGLGNIYELQKRLDQAEDAYLQAFHIFRKLSQAKTEAPVLNLAESCLNLGDIYHMRNQVKKAENILLKGLNACRQLCEESGSMDSKTELALLYERLGHLYYRERHYREAEYHYQQETLLLETLLKEAGTITIRSNLFHCLSKRADLAKAQNQWEEAKKLYEDSCKLAQELYRETGESPDIGEHLAVAYDKLGNYYRDLGNPRKAMFHYTDEQALRLSLMHRAKDRGNLQSKRGLSVCYTHLGQAQEQAGKLDMAEHYYSRALSMDEGIYSAAKTPDAKRDLAFSYESMGSIRYKRQKPKEALPNYLQAAELYRQLSEDKSVLTLEDMARVCYNTACVSAAAAQQEINRSQALEYWRMAESWSRQTVEYSQELYMKTGMEAFRNDMETGRQVLADALQHIRQMTVFQKQPPDGGGLAPESPRETTSTFEQYSRQAIVSQLKDNIARYDRLIDACGAEGRSDDKLRYCLAAIKACRQLCDLEPTSVTFWKSLAFHHHWASTIYAIDLDGQFSRAEEYWKSGMDLYQWLYDQTHLPDIQDELAYGYELLADFLRRQERWSETIEAHRSELSVLLQLCKSQQDLNYTRRTAACYSHLAYACIQLPGGQGTGKHFFEEEAALREEIFNTTKTADAYDKLADVYYNLGVVSGGEQGIPYFQKALDIWNDLIQQFPENSVYLQKRNRFYR